MLEGVAMPKKTFKIFSFYFSLFTFAFSLVYAQQPTQEWVVRIPGPNNDLIGPFLQVDNQGNSYIAGTHLINDSMNILVVKYNTSGTQIWAALYKFPGESYFQPMGLALDTFGNAYVSALYGHILSINNIVTIKFSSQNGTVLWAKKYIGQYGQSYVDDIEIDPLNGIYVVGSSDSSHLIIKYNIDGDSVWVRRWKPAIGSAWANDCTIDDSLNIITTGERRHCLVPMGCFDTMLTVKYSKDGDLRWIRTYTYNYLGNYGKKIVADQYGSVYIAAWARISPSVSISYLTTKYDRNGNQQWVSVYNGQSGYDIIRSITFDRIFNSVIVTGSSSGQGSNTDYATIKYNVLTGDSIWVRRYNGPLNSFDDAREVITDPLGNSYVTGLSNMSAGGVNVLTLKYSQQGNTDWIITYDGPANGFDVGNSLRMDTSNNVYVLGGSQGDYIVIKYNQLSGIIQNSNNIPNRFYLTNYPNPFNSQTGINFGLSHISRVDIKIYDIQGREVKNLAKNEELKAGGYKITWDAANFSSGIYFCRINAVYKLNNTNQIFTRTTKLVFSK